MIVTFLYFLMVGGGWGLTPEEVLSQQREVFGYNNLAANQSVKQSSTNSGEYVASNAVDGNTDDSEPLSRTNSEDQPWWQVDLGQTRRISCVVIFPCSACEGDQILSNFHVTLYDDSYQIVTTFYEPGEIHKKAFFFADPIIMAELLEINMVLSLDGNISAAVGPDYLPQAERGKFVRVQLRGKGSLSLVEVEVYGESNLQQLLENGRSEFQNVALKKSARQSSNYSHPCYPIPYKAIDGNTDGEFLGCSVTHTNDDKQSWWEVDLGQTLEISSVFLFNRVDVDAMMRLSNFDVTLFDKSRKVVKSLYESGGGDPIYAFLLQPMARARYVRVQLRDKQFLSLAEVEVYGYENVAILRRKEQSNYENLALHKPANQSSLYTGNLFHQVASKAVDGDIRGARGTASHTEDEKKPWWEVDLGTTAEISSIFLFNRLDCCQFRLSDFDVTARNTSRHVVWTVHVPSNEGSRANYSLLVYPPISGQYVSVQLRGKNPLSLAEVEIYGSKLDVE